MTAGWPAIFGLGMLAACVSCVQDAGPLPEPRRTTLQGECYPVNYLHPPPLPSPGSCPLEHPERASSYVIVVTVGADGSVLDATVPGEPSEAVHTCVMRAVGRWKLEPARNCLGEALPAKYEVEYPYVLGYTCFHWWEAGASGASG